jgi:hypothetical protein
MKKNKIKIENKRVKRINGREWVEPFIEQYYCANNMLVARKRRRGKLRGIEFSKICINESTEIDKDCWEKLLKQINYEKQKNTMV